MSNYFDHLSSVTSGSHANLVKSTNFECRHLYTQMPVILNVNWFMVKNEDL